ncbi:unnamed protein product [Lampetra planeri]
MDDLKNKLINYESPNQGIPANILLLGRSGHGKSSFINTCETALSDRIRSRAVTASSTGSSTTQHFLKYQLTSFQNQKETPINVNVMDTIGWEPQTFTFEMFNKILNGQIEDKQSFSDKTEITSEPRNKVHCVAYVADMDQFQNMELDDLDSFKRFGRYARQKENINTFVIITKVDACLPEGTSISDIYKVKNIETRMKEICSALECDEKFVFPMINYRDCMNVDTNKNILALSLISALVDAASDFIYNNKKKAANEMKHTPTPN